MIDRSDIEAMRPLLAAMCRKPEFRAHPPNIGTGRHRWHPFTVREQASMSRFSDAGAWECIAECLERGADINYKPPNEEFKDHAYEMIDASSGLSDIYIKIALRDGLPKLLGISFHYATS